MRYSGEAGCVWERCACLAFGSRQPPGRPSKALTEARGDLDSVPRRFNDDRLADAHSLYELDRKAYSFFR